MKFSMYLIFIFHYHLDGTPLNVEKKNYIYVNLISFYYYLLLLVFSCYPRHGNSN